MFPCQLDKTYQKDNIVKQSTVDIKSKIKQLCKRQSNLVIMTTKLFVIFRLTFYKESGIME